MASFTCHVLGGTKRLRLERIVRSQPALQLYGLLTEGVSPPSTDWSSGERSLLSGDTGTARAHMSVAEPPIHCSYGSVLMVAKSAQSGSDPELPRNCPQSI